MENACLGCIKNLVNPVLINPVLPKDPAVREKVLRGERWKKKARKEFLHREGEILFKNTPIYNLILATYSLLFYKIDYPYYFSSNV